MEVTTLLARLTPALVVAASPGRDTTDTTRSIMSAVGWILLILVVAVTLFVVALWAKGRWFGGPDPGVTTGGVVGGFTISDLKRMRDSGEISDDEFERARERIVVTARREMSDEADAADDPERPQVGSPITKDVDLIRDAEQ